MNNNNYILRYVYEVTKRLPANEREDVRKELETNIYDMLSDDPTKSEIEAVLKSLGKPSEIAKKYQKDGRYLISPKYYDSYLTSLKNAMIILAVIGFISGIFTAFFVEPRTDIVDVIGLVFEKGLGGIIEGIIYALVIVTVIYVIIERVNQNKEVEVNKEWSIDDLSELPALSGTYISKASVTFDIIFTTLFSTAFIFFIYNHQKYLGWVKDVNNKLTLTTPLFTNSIKYFIIPLVLLTIFEIFNRLMLLKDGVKTVKSYILIGIEIGLALLTFLIMISLKTVFNNDFTTKLELTFGSNGVKVFDYAVAFVQVGLIIGIIVTIIYTIIKVVKANEFNKK